MRIFFDSSAFAKRYVSEEGSDTVLLWFDQATELCLSGIALPEIISQKFKEGNLSGFII